MSKTVLIVLGFVATFVLLISLYKNTIKLKVQDTSITFAAGATYYIDCSNGNDTNNGTSVASAWKTISKANTAPLNPGDKLLFKRECIWNGRLQAGWIGTDTAPIIISDYGTGALPSIQTSPSLSSGRVEITGKYQIIENLDVRTINPNTDPNCNNQTIGYFVGFNFLGTSSNNIVRNSRISNHTIGIHITDNSNHNKIINNEIYNNSVMNHLTRDPSPDLGAWGMVLRGDDNEIASNYFHDNNGWCAYDFSIKPGNAVELYNADRNNIHHNTVINDRVFSEVGHDSSHTSDNNIWAYNLYYSTTKTSRFLVLHSNGNPFGPVNGSKVYNNTVYLTGPTSTGIGGGESHTIIKNNIIVATDRLTNVSGMIQTNNIWWNSTGPIILSQLGENDKKVDPEFVNAAANNFHLKANSPAINSGTTNENLYKLDLDGNSIPQGITYDIGAYEVKNTQPTPTPTDCSGTNAYSVIQSHGYTATKSCLTLSSTLYSDDSRFTYFSIPETLKNISIVKTGNINEKSDLGFSLTIKAVANIKIYVMYRKIPGQQIPSWIDENFSKITPEGYENLPSFILRKNDQGLIGVYDIYQSKIKLSPNESITLGPASDANNTAFSMYLIGIASL